jgi:dTDP-4-dehydrorhamnose 3,5-epimerase-like enzyme
LRENFWVLSGAALWIFHDFNKKSKTYGKTWSVTLGFTPLLTKEGLGVVARGTKSYFINDGKLAQIEVPPYVYHAFWPLTNQPVIAVATGTTGYDPADFVRPKIEEVPGAIRILKKYKIKP